MKTQRAVLPLAFLSAAFMLGCQDQGLEPVGPEGLAPLFDPGGAGKNPTGKKKGGSVLADLTLGLHDTGEPATGLVNSALQEVAFKDGEGTIQFERGADDRKGILGIELAFALTETHGKGRAACNVTGPGRANALANRVDDLDSLFNELVDGPARAPDKDTGELNSFWVSIDKTALDPTSGTGTLDPDGLNVTWLSKGATRGDRQLTLGAKEPPATVTVSGEFGDSDDPLTFVFTEGRIRLFNHSGKLKERFGLSCPNSDIITMILTSQP